MSHLPDTFYFIANTVFYRAPVLGRFWFESLNIYKLHAYKLSSVVEMSVIVTIVFDDLDERTNNRYLMHSSEFPYWIHCIAPYEIVTKIVEKITVNNVSVSYMGKIIASEIDWNNNRFYLAIMLIYYAFQIIWFRSESSNIQVLLDMLPILNQHWSFFVLLIFKQDFLSLNAW